MDKMNFEDDVNLFWEECDSWIAERLKEIASQVSGLSGYDIDGIEVEIEEKINSFIEKGVMTHGQKFSPQILKDLHHLYFELELQKMGIPNADYIHRYKENGQVGISSVEGKITPDNALLVMELNRAHLDKKRGNDNGICEDCICGKK